MCIRDRVCHFYFLPFIPSPWQGLSFLFPPFHVFTLTRSVISMSSLSFPHPDKVCHFYVHTFMSSPWHGLSFLLSHFHAFSLTGSVTSISSLSSFTLTRSVIIISSNLIWQSPLFFSTNFHHFNTSLFTVKSYLCLVIWVGTENFLDTLCFLQQFGHGAGVVLQLSGSLLLGVEHFGQVIPQPKCHLQTTQVSVIAGEDMQWSLYNCTAMIQLQPHFSS